MALCVYTSCTNIEITKALQSARSFPPPDEAAAGDRRPRRPRRAFSQTRQKYRSLRRAPSSKCGRPRHSLFTRPAETEPPGAPRSRQSPGRPHRHIHAVKRRGNSKAAAHSRTPERGGDMPPSLFHEGGTPAQGSAPICRKQSRKDISWVFRRKDISVCLLHEISSTVESKNKSDARRQGVSAPRPPRERLSGTAVLSLPVSTGSFWRACCAG